LRRLDPSRIEVVDDDTASVLRLLTGAERLQIAFALTAHYKRRWLEALRSEFPAATAQEFRAVVIARLLDESAEERRICEALGRRAEVEKSGATGSDVQ